ncbi:MAG: DUF4252 domain-containing protein [Cellulophaga sp.]|uniref:DUF4252 domain-containing protein n=1 Tax=unclassified Cellulophaga TaxID=2634405 RepID=UPI000C2BD4C6|nr:MULTISPECIES: DUF4252 domain-containing protein [unclassified Cellulophaga]MDO6492131.1 DUF4252 domain-containing protein [Cellulophaga sp. 2_MG-2023]MDO6495708.1 DUF4252 domain-containing protein [Cellulophaga sp. 3_MG-2023]PKB43838.1 uncharacterized protein DUF4252 [Cellulophaga sp. RHA19]
MKNSIKYIAAALTLLVTLGSCSSSQSLQEYYVDSNENENFISFDIPTSILNIASADLSPEEKKAVESIKKVNVLAFNKTTDNVASYKVEKTKVNSILSNKKYTQLMKINSKMAKGVVKFTGEEDAIDEVIVYGYKDDKGFALIRVVGDNMNPAYLGKFISAMEKSNVDEGAFKDLGKLLKS